MQYIESTLCGKDLDVPVHRSGPFILMVPRPSHMDDCPIEDQVRRAQDIGALAVLTVNDRCSSFNTACRIEAKEFASKTQRTVYTDVSIPAVLMYKEDADAIKMELQKSQEVVVLLSIALPPQTEQVEFDIWTTPLDHDASIFLKEFEIAVNLLEDKVLFTPHMIVNRCPVDASHWRYCDPYFDSLAMLEMDSVIESLRRICIWQIYGSGYGRLWWEYVNDFSQSCIGPLTQKEKTLEECALEILRSHDIDPDTVNSCMEKSGGHLDQPTHVPNDLLEEAVESANRDGKEMNQASIYVNQVKILGTLSFENVFQAICSGFAELSLPEVCMECVDQEMFMQACVRRHTAEKFQKSGGTGGESLPISFAWFCFAWMCLVTLLGTATYVYMQRNRRFVHSRVNAILQEYMQLPQSDSA